MRPFSEKIINQQYLEAQVYLQFKINSIEHLNLIHDISINKSFSFKINKYSQQKIMSDNFNRGNFNLGYDSSLGSNQNNNPHNSYPIYGYPNSQNPNFNHNPHFSTGPLGQNSATNQWNQTPSQYRQPSNQWGQPSNQWNQPPTNWNQQQNQWNSTSTQLNQPSNRNIQQANINPYNTQNPYNQPSQINNPSTFQYPSLNQNRGFSGDMGGYYQKENINNFEQQMNKLNINGKNEDEKGIKALSQILGGMDWDSLLKKKNVMKKQSDTSWVNYQQQSWLKSHPSQDIQIQTEKKFAFPNPYIKYKIIPGVDQKMALDVTSKDQLDKGLVRGNLIIWEYHGGPNQQFYIHRCPKNSNQQSFNSFQQPKITDDQFILINASTGFVVSALNLTTKSMSNKQNKNRLCVFPKMQNTQSQRWKLIPLNERGDIFMIQSVETGKVLDVEEASRSNGANVIQWESNKQKNQLWKILPA